MLEKVIEAALRVSTLRHGGLCLKWVCPSVRGVPDRIVLLPRGRIVFVECKSPTGKLRPEQIRMLRRLRELGFRVAVVRSVEVAHQLPAHIVSA